MRPSHTLIAAVVSICIGCAQADSGVPSLETRAVTRGPLIDTVLATGRVHTVASVDVSSQLSGRIDEVLVDFNDRVVTGQPLARLDPQQFQSRVEELQAGLAVARAELAAAEAALSGAKARADEDAREYQRLIELGKRGSVSDSEITRARALKQQSASNVATLAAARDTKAANILAAKASLRQAQIDLERTVIRTPISGVVINRNIEPGQTVAVSLSAPELFTIADDLSNVEVHAKVDEADIGKVRVSQPVSFTVDAYPGRKFSGRVAQIRKAPEIAQNVVSYAVIISAVNPDEVMLPGMTALVQIVTARKERVLQVPNAALRFVMPDTLRQQRSDASSGHAQSSVWVRAKGSYESIPVKLGDSNAESSEVRAGDLAPGDQVVVGYLR